MNAIKLLKQKREVEEALEKNCSMFNAVEEEMFSEKCSEDKYAELNQQRENLLEEGMKLTEELETLDELINSLIIVDSEEPSGITIADVHYDSKEGVYKPSLGTALIKDEEGNLVEVKLRPDNLIRSQWGNSFIEGHKYKWSGRPVKKRPFHNVDFEWVCFVTHIEEVVE